MATDSSVLAWRIPWTEELGGLQSTGRKKSGTTERLNYHQGKGIGRRRKEAVEGRSKRQKGSP